MRIFVDVDVQNDFCLPSGALAVAGSPNDLYRALTRHAESHRIPVVGSVDSHAFDAWEFASSSTSGPHGEKPNFPDHCVKGTAGWLKIEGTLPKRFRFVPCVAGLDATRADERGDPREGGSLRSPRPHSSALDAGRLASELASGAAGGIYFEKEVYSLFANPNAEGVLAELRRRAEGALECVVYGVATDHCVRAAALGLRERGYDTVLLGDAVRGITDEGTRAALDELQRAGVRFTSAAEILGGAA